MHEIVSSSEIKLKECEECAVYLLFR